MYPATDTRGTIAAARSNWVVLMEGEELEGLDGGV